MRPFFIVTKFYVPTVRGTVGYKGFFFSSTYKSKSSSENVSLAQIKF